MATATPFLMFQGGAAQAAMDLYTATLPDSRVVRADRYGPGEPGPEGTLKSAVFIVCGREFMCSDSPIKHNFSFTPANSIFVEFDTAEELDRVFGVLSKGGRVLMPLDNYGFSRRFGWLDDRFGVSWQMNLPRLNGFHAPLNSMQIRQIRADELDALLGLYLHLYASDAPLPDRAVVQAVWRELLADPRYRYFGGYAEEKLVTSCALTVIPNLTRGCRPYGIIENVVTHADHRNRGYGKAILAHALAHAWSVGCYKVTLSTSRKDEATLRFYESAGFDPHDKRAFAVRAPA